MRFIFIFVAILASSLLRAAESQTPGTEGTHPLSPAEALRSFKTKPGLRVELVASEPLIQDPVAIDWSADGRLWVCEMNDYPSGMDANWQPGGRVKFLTDDDGDGRFDRATLFLENIPFPTGITAWGRGIFVCAAPDLLYAEDTNGDGKADKIEKLFTGFFPDNYQARVNSLNIGLDNWIYAANGLLGGNIQPLKNSLFPAAPEPVDIRNRDFRFHPFRGTLETVSGLTQQGRARDDWGNWFGTDNTRLLLHFPVPENYIRRNPHVPANPSTLELTARRDGHLLFPTSRTLERFNDPDNANRTTSACGVGIYRDTILGEEFYGNAFTCEPVHNLVHREIIHRGLSLTSERAPDENNSEFLTSTDNWFRPAQARPGPDGALYIVDMYRFLIEHPRWIPAARLAQIDIRAGADRGRIYRVVSLAHPLRPIRDLTKLQGAELASALNTPNGIDRDRVQIELLLHQDKNSIPKLKELARLAELPQVRLHAFATLCGITPLDPDEIRTGLQDSAPEVRAHALRLSEPLLKKATSQSAGLLQAVLQLTNDASVLVVRQLAFTLGESISKEAGHALAALSTSYLSSAEVRTAVLSSAVEHCDQILTAIMSLEESTPGRADCIAPLIATAANSPNLAHVLTAITAALPKPDVKLDEAQMSALAALLANIERRKTKLENLLDPPMVQKVRAAISQAITIAADDQAPENKRRAALNLLGHSRSEESIPLLTRAARASSENLRHTAIAALQYSKSPAIPPEIFTHWRETGPAARADLLSLLLQREEWSLALLNAVKEKIVQPLEIGRADRQRLASIGNAPARALAAELLPLETITSRAQILSDYKVAATIHGNAAAGAEVFTHNCSACHSLNGIGHQVGPDLLPLRTRDADYWIKNILDPNAVIEPRFVNYQIDLKDDRNLSGVIKNESANSLTLASGGGILETISRSEVVNIRASSLSLMPEGLEQGVSPKQMADLIAFLTESGASKEVTAVTASPRDNEVLRDPVSVARFILDSTRSDAARSTAINANPQFAAALVKEMVRDLVPGTPEEYTRIPWIWRVAIACGRRNDAGQMKEVIKESLPEENEPLRDWQAVVLGGGIINGLSQRGLWPAERIHEILGDDKLLASQWARALALAAAMADDEKVPAGTRYDALRMLAMQGWDRAGAQLVRYLPKGTHPELQMGAVSALADINSSEAAAVLEAALPHLAGENLELARKGLSRRVP